MDMEGHLAAGTSTGGIAGKMQGRVGDSPLVGGGLYANDRVCAVSATGTGERIMEAVAAHEVAAGMRLAGLPIQRAVEDACAVVQGDIGLIAVDARGRVGIACNTPIFQRAVGDRRRADAHRARRHRLDPLARAPGSRCPRTRLPGPPPRRVRGSPRGGRDDEQAAAPQRRHDALGRLHVLRA